ncbi:MAG: hypothetical protein RL095_262 [Verrucomicrobiota bacterium]|jgi:hypothetical protein
MERQSTLLQQIQTAAVDPKIDISSLLRLCLILAYKLNHDKFKDWVNSELDGYRDKENIPEYRKFRTLVLGHFIGRFQSLKDVQLPELNVPEDLRDIFFCCDLGEGISEIDNLIKSCKAGVVNTAIPQDFINLIEDNFYNNMKLVGVKKLIPESRLVKIIDTIKTKIILFTLEIESQCSDFEMIKTNTSQMNIVNHIYKTVIMGDVENMAAGSKEFTQGQQN